MFNSKIQLATLDIDFNNLSGLEDNKEFRINGSISIGLSINGSILSKLEPLVDQAIRFNTNKQIGKDRIQRELDSLELLEIELRKARLQKQLRDLEK